MPVWSTMTRFIFSVLPMDDMTMAPGTNMPSDACDGTKENPCTGGTAAPAAGHACSGDMDKKEEGAACSGEAAKPAGCNGAM